MPRPLRIEYENAWYHVMNRGANKKAIFRKDSHRHMFLSLLEEISNVFAVEIHAYCLMGNHYHLLMKTPQGNLGRAMRHLNGLYTQRFNQCEKRDGPLFRGRYKAILVEADSYLLQVSRYIHLNPTEAKLCTNINDYPWSSYPSYVGLEKPKIKLYTDFILSQISKFKQKDKYAEFVSQGTDKELENFYQKKHQSPILGSDHFITQQLMTLDDEHKKSCQADINRAHTRPGIEIIFQKLVSYFNIPKSNLLSSTRGELNESRLIGIYLAKNLCQLTHAEIAKHFTQLSISGVGAAIKRCKQLLKKDKLFKLKFDELMLSLVG